MAASTDLGPVTALAGVGPARARALAKLSVRSVRDLLFLMPRRLDSSCGIQKIAEAVKLHGRAVRVGGSVRKKSMTRMGRRSTLRVTLADDTGSITALFFNQPWMRKHINIGDELELEGRVVSAKSPALASPKVGTKASPLRAPESLVPLYPTVDGLGQEFLRKMCRAAMHAHARNIEDPVSATDLDRLALPVLAKALIELHEPTSADAFERARRRLALERLLGLQAGLEERRRDRQRGSALTVAPNAELDRAIRSRFSFTLTPGQDEVVRALRADLARSVPMRRLLQGDVGSGKTVLGLYACMAVAHAGGQAAFLAPTELLCEQHFDGLRASLAQAGLTSVLLTGSVSAAERKSLLAKVGSGAADVVFGTHALFSDDVRYKRLALAVIDEQQRFGVAQRARLFDKGRDVHVLLMTATPIPRTLALTLYADLDTSVLRDRPANRGAVKTRRLRSGERPRLKAFVTERLRAGEQVYWVVPRIEAEDEKSGGSAYVHGAEQIFERLKASELAQFGVELVHGRLQAEERAERLERFRAGRARVLVATTVIEVGVDVPAATVMVIENAERLGLAQLHQLRGRVGRGPAASWCFLSGSASARERMELLERTHDGFAIAEEDLRRRGMGDLTGLRQAGENGEGLDDLAADLDLLLAARELVQSRESLFEAYRSRSSEGPPP